MGGLVTMTLGKSSSDDRFVLWCLDQNNAYEGA
jgi:hypothetical protein